MEEITTAVDQKLCVSIFVDLNKTFDSIDHYIVI